MISNLEHQILKQLIESQIQEVKSWIQDRMLNIKPNRQFPYKNDMLIINNCSISKSKKQVFSKRKIYITVKDKLI